MRQGQRQQSPSGEALFFNPALYLDVPMEAYRGSSPPYLMLIMAYRGVDYCRKADVLTRSVSADTNRSGAKLTLPSTNDGGEHFSHLFAKLRPEKLYRSRIVKIPAQHEIAYLSLFLDGTARLASIAKPQQILRPRPRNSSNRCHRHMHR